MSYVYSWSVVAWLGGIVVGASEGGALTLIGSSMALVAFFMISSAEDAA